MGTPRTSWTGRNCRQPGDVFRIFLAVTVSNVLRATVSQDGRPDGGGIGYRSAADGGRNSGGDKVFDREDVIGLLLLGLCVVVGVVLVFGIVTGTRWEYRGPGWLGWVLTILFVGGLIYGFVTRPGGRWPDPRTGRRRRWPWSRGRDEEEQ